MEKDHSQLELFTKTKEDFDTKPSTARPFLSHVRGHEKVILGIICAIVIGITSFCVGFEKGKASVAFRNNAINVETVTKTIPPVKPQVKSPLMSERYIPAAQTQKQNIALQQPLGTGNFTIQIGTYQTRSGALKEAEMLKKKGFAASVFAKGAYTVLCVGNFRTQEAAKQSLGELKKRYRDCFIRRL